MIEGNYKLMVNCEEALVLRSQGGNEFVGELEGQRIRFASLSRFPQLVSANIVNSVSIDDEFMRTIQSTFVLSVYNYVSIPRRSAVAGLAGPPFTELLVFMNKTNRRGTPQNFAKADEILGQLASNVNGIMERCERANAMYEREKYLKSFTYCGAEELLSCVFCDDVIGPDSTR